LLVETALLAAAVVLALIMTFVEDTMVAAFAFCGLGAVLGVLYMYLGAIFVGLFHLFVYSGLVTILVIVVVTMTKPHVEKSSSHE